MSTENDPKMAATIAQGQERNQKSLTQHRVVSQEEWHNQRLALMDKEKHYVRLGDELSAEVRSLPWVKVEKEYLFISPNGDVMLKDLFREHRQLFIKHFMMEPAQKWQCEGCTLESNHVDGLLPYFENHDMSYVAVSRAPLEEIETVRGRMGWKFCWVSSYTSDFNYDFHVSFRPEEVAAGRAIYKLPRKKDRPKDVYAVGP